jgi:hypothetical protein
MEGIRKAMNERNLKEGQWEDREQWSLGVGQRVTFISVVSNLHYIPAFTVVLTHGSPQHSYTHICKKCDNRFKVGVEEVLEKYIKRILGLEI